MPRGRVIQWTVLRGGAPDAAIPAAPKTAEVIHLWGEPWSAEKVKARLVLAYAALPGRVVFAREGGDLEFVAGGPIGHLDLIRLCEMKMPGRDSLTLKKYAAATARDRIEIFWAWCEGAGIRRPGERVDRLAARLGRIMGHPSTWREIEMLKQLQRIAAAEAAE